MRFSTPTSIITLHPSTSASSTASNSNIKKVFAILRNKLPTSSSNGSTSSAIVKNNSTTVIKVVAKPKTSVSSIKKQQDINKDLRQFYTQNTRKRQLSHEGEQQLNDKKREIRHKTVKQYQQIKNHHWKEEHSVINNHAENIYNTHHYVRDTRSNSNYLRIMATTHNPTSAKPFIKKRSDVFIYGRQSNLRNAL